MTREDIIRMAREAGLMPDNSHPTPQTRHMAEKQERLEHFAALVAAAKDAEHQQTLALQQRSYEREIQLEVEAEREACAKVCEETDLVEYQHCMVLHIDGHATLRNAAAAIRARGNT